VELLAQKRTGRATGWLGYTLSRAERAFAAFQDGRPFPYRYDRRHDVAATLRHRLKDGVDLSATWVYGTGDAVWLPVGALAVPPHTPGPEYASLPGFGGFPDDEAAEALYYGPRNASRLRANHRLDLGLRLYRRTRRGERSLSLALYNAYNRKNPFYLYVDEDAAGRRVFKQVSLYPLIPSISYGFSF
jgi:hypothetical protein